MASSNYPNMSYCMMENTNLALQQVLENMEEALNNGPKAVQEFFQDSSAEEQQAFQSLFNACREFVKLAEEIEECREEAYIM